MSRQRQILDVAARLFRHYGFAKTTVADIAREAEIGVGSVYLEFSSKEAIAAALSADSHQRMLEEMRAAARGDGDFADCFRAMMEARVRALVRYAEEGAHGLDLIHCCDASAKVREEHRRAEEELVIEFFARANKASIFDVDDTRALAPTVLRIYDGFTPEGQGPCRADLDGELEAVHRLVLYGLMQR